MAHPNSPDMFHPNHTKKVQLGISITCKHCCNEVLRWLFFKSCFLQWIILKRGEVRSYLLLRIKGLIYCAFLFNFRNLSLVSMAW